MWCQNGLCNLSAFSFAVLSCTSAHYPGTVSSDNAPQTGKKLWASEDYSTYNDDTGAGCWARVGICVY